MPRIIESSRVFFVATFRLNFQQGCTATMHKYQPQRGFCSDCWVQLLCTKTEPTKRSDFTTWKVDGATLMSLGLSWPLTNRHLLRVAPSTFTTVQMIVKFLSSLFSSRHYFLNDHQKRHTIKNYLQLQVAKKQHNEVISWHDCNI